MKEIKKLIYLPNYDQFGNYYGEIPPTTRQIVNKLNEIIDWINEQKRSEK